MAFSDFLFGKKEKVQKLPTLTKQQQGFQDWIMNQVRGTNLNIQQNPLYQSGASYLQNLLSGSPEAFEAFEAPHLRQFQEQVVPALAERFSGLGAGSQRSSAFQQALGQAGAGLQENLASLRAGLQGQAASQALGYAQQPIANAQGFAGYGLQPSFENVIRPRTQGLLGGLLGGGAGAFGSAGGSAIFSKLAPFIGLGL